MTDSFDKLRPGFCYLFKGKLNWKLSGIKKWIVQPVPEDVRILEHSKRVGFYTVVDGYRVGVYECVDGKFRAQNACEKGVPDVHLVEAKFKGEVSVPVETPESTPEVLPEN